MLRVVYLESMPRFTDTDRPSLHPGFSVMVFYSNQFVKHMQASNMKQFHEPYLATIWMYDKNV